jgi:hypothetical protein
MLLMAGGIPFDLPQQSSTKNQIINVLSDKWPLTAKQICARLKKKHASTRSYQAVHKMLLQLADEGVILKKGKNYALNGKWISDLKNFSTGLEERYSKKQKKYILDKDFSGTVSWVFDDYSTFCLEMAKLLASGILVGKNKPQGIGLLRHAWWPLKFKFADFELLKEMIKNNNGGYVVVQENMPLDKWIAKRYRESNFLGVKTGERMQLKKDTVIHGECILEVKYSEETKKMLDDIYGNTKNIGDLFKQYMRQKISKKQGKIEVAITKNPELAAFLKVQLIDKYFGH